MDIIGTLLITAAGITLFCMIFYTAVYFIVWVGGAITIGLARLAAVFTKVYRNNLD